MVILFSLVDYRGYGYYVLLLIIPILFHKLPYKYFDSYFWILLIWGCIYGLTVILFTGTVSYGASLQYMINYPILYIGGKYLVSNLTSKRLGEILGLAIIAFSLIAILSVIKDIMENGFMVIGLARNIPLIGINNEEGYIAATGISTRLLPAISLIGLLMFRLQKQDNKLKSYYVVYGCVAFICAIRIQSRTSVVFLGIILLLGLFRNVKSNDPRKIILSIVTLLIISCIAIYCISNYSEELVILNRFENESNTDGGGRLELLVTVVNLLPQYPFGGIFMNKDIRYAHNFWIDCGRVAGVIPMLLLILVSILYLIKLYRLNKIKGSDNSLICQLFNLVTISFVIEFFAEPVLEGIPMFGGLFILFGGMLDKFINLFKSNFTYKTNNT